MDCIGTINFESEMDETRWKSLLASHEELTPTDRIETINPFTKETSIITTPGELATVYAADDQIGALRWSKLGSGIDVFGDRQKMQPFIERLASELEGWFDPI